MGNNEQRILKLDAGSYQTLFGVKKNTFDLMLSVLEAAFKDLHKRGGKPTKLTVLDKLIITLDYYKNYRPFDRIAFDYSVGKSAICKSVAWVESVLIKDKRFQLPNKKELGKTEFEVILVDCTESPIQRPKKNSENITPANKNGIL